MNAGEEPVVRSRGRWKLRLDVLSDTVVVYST